jgi:16S rRNA (adenine1518-N6/adenine1519-N6)-dimethyltransferase
MHGHRARKRFGQHFLSDQTIIESLLDCIDPQDGERIIEIGPGLGALTEPLLQRISALAAIELDRDLASRLQQRYNAGQLELIQADALRVDWEALLVERKARLVGNLPYNISSPLLVRLAQCAERVIDQHFMLQREVVQRIVATQGAHYGRLGILLQAFYQCENVLDVPPQAFTPPPRVDSAVVRMIPLSRPRVPDADLLSGLLAAAFNQRRKMLRGTLLPWLEQQGIDGNAIDPQARAEQIPGETYYALATEMADRKRKESS